MLIYPLLYFNMIIRTHSLLFFWKGNYQHKSITLFGKQMSLELYQYPSFVLLLYCLHLSDHIIYNFVTRS